MGAPATLLLVSVLFGWGRRRAPSESQVVAGLSGGVEQAQAAPPGQGCGAAAGTELAVDVVQVPLERALGDEQGIRDLAIAQNRIELAKDLQLAAGQLFHRQRVMLRCT